jgi:branched-chain amino acid transport system permease protein
MSRIDWLRNRRAQLAQHPLLPVGAALCAFFLVPYFGLSGGQYFLLVTIVLYAAMAMGLTVIWGFCGQPSFGHAALFGVGAYTVAILTGLHHWGVWPALALAPLAAAVAGLIFALPAARGAPTDQVALATLALCIVLQVIEDAAQFTGASDGIPGVAALELFGATLIGPEQYYRPALVTLVVAYVVVRLLRGSAAGRSMLAVRGDELAARTLGARVVPLKLLAFAIGGALAGLAGGVYATFAGFVSSVAFDVNLSFQVAVMIIIGGVSRPSGAIAGAAVVLVIQDRLQTHGAVSLAVTGLMLIVVILLRTGAARRGALRLRAAVRRQLLARKVR